MTTVPEIHAEEGGSSARHTVGGSVGGRGKGGRGKGVAWQKSGVDANDAAWSSNARSHSRKRAALPSKSSSCAGPRAVVRCASIAPSTSARAVRISAKIPLTCDAPPADRASLERLAERASVPEPGVARCLGAGSQVLSRDGVRRCAGV